MKARIYYGDGSVVEDTGSPPARDVQVIVQPHPGVNVELVTGQDYYVRMSDGRWKGVDLFGLFDYLLDSGIVLFGRTITKAEYNAIYQQAKADKAGWTQYEVRVEDD